MTLAPGNAFFDNQICQSQEWLTTEEAAAYLRISIASLRNLTSNGRVIYYKLGRRVRYQRTDLQNLLLQNKRGGHSGVQ